MNIRPIRLLSLSLLALALTGCGDLEAEKVDLEGWTVTVTPDPVRVTYLPGELVTATAEVRTAEGALIAEPVLDWTATGASAEGEGQYRLAPFEALGRITACLNVEEESVCGDAELPIDITPPTVTVLTPSPGDELLASDSDGSIVVTGTVEDTNPDARLSVFVNGGRAEISPDGTFEYALPAEFGITHLVIEGSDGFHPPTRSQMDVLMADGYLPPEDGTTRFELDSAMAIRLTQKFFDPLLGGTDLDPGASPVVAENLAAIVELVLLHLDLSGLFGEGPIFEEPGVFELGIVSASIGDAVVDVAIVDDAGLRITLDVSEVFVELDGFIDLGLATEGDVGVFTIEGGIETDIGGSLDLTLAPDASGQLVGGIENVALEVASFRPMFTGEYGAFWNALIDLPSVQGAFHAILEAEIEAQLVSEFVDVIPTLLTDLLNSISDIFAGLEIELPLPPELGDPLTVALDSQLEALSMVGGAESGRVDLALSLTVETLSAPVHADARGLPQADMDPAPPFGDALGLQLAVRQDFINGLLHSLWNAGLLDVVVQVSGAEAVVTPRLPPVLRMAPPGTTCTVDGTRCDAILQIGQVEISALGAVSAIALDVGAVVDFTGEAISLKIDQAPEVVLWEVTRSSATPLLNTFLLSMLETDILPALTDLVGEELLIELPLPTPESLGLADLAPGLAAAELDIESAGRIESTTGYLGLGADVRLVVP